MLCTDKNLSIITNKVQYEQNDIHCLLQKVSLNRWNSYSALHTKWQSRENTDGWSDHNETH